MSRERIDSQQAWLGKVPRQWELAPLGSVFRERKVTVSDTDYSPLSVSMQGILPRMENVALTANGDARKLVRAGDYVINSRSDRKGSGGIAPTEGSVSVISTVLEPRGIEPAFAHHLLRSTAFQEEFYRWGSGIVDDLWSTRYPAMRRITLALPPLTEQRAIADYLDRETAKIDTLIEKQTTMIERLRERRAAVITRVAGFAEKRAAASPTDGWGGSSVSCVAKPMRSLLVQRVSDGPHETPVFQDSGVPFLSVDGIQNGELVFDSKTRFISRLDHLRYSRKARPQVGDVLMGKAASTGKIAEVKVTFEFNVWSPLAILRPRAEVSPSWLAYALKSASSQAQVDLLCTNNTQKNLAMADIPRIVLAVPTLEKQREIADYLDRETVKIDMLIAKVERHIELARERRAALITAAVTGQIDVTISTQSGDAA